MTLLEPSVNPRVIPQAGQPTGQDAADGRLRVLFLVSAHNGLSQRLLAELREQGHAVTVAVVESGGAMEAAVEAYRPELIVCPFLKAMIPETIWSDTRCLIVHPGPRGDRGPSSLDWAIERGSARWGVTVIEANGEADAGTVLATREFTMRTAPKSSVYRHEVRRAAVAAVMEAIERLGAVHVGETADPGRPVKGWARPLMTQAVRAIDWDHDSTDTIMRKIHAADGHPGVLDSIQGERFHLFGAHREGQLHGDPGTVIAHRHGAICRATVDGAVWITHLKGADTSAERYFKLPATSALALSGSPVDVPEIGLTPEAPTLPGGTYRDIVYEEHGQVGYLEFDFHNGAMSTDQCQRLHAAYRDARSRETRVIVLLGGSDYFSNGIHLNVIEAANDPALESWRNLIAIDDLVAEIIATESHLVISALRGDAAAGGVPLALAADLVLAREDIVLNPYYRHMGALYGSEYWTYLLPKRVGQAEAQRITSAPFAPVGTPEAMRLGLIDGSFGENLVAFDEEVRRLAVQLAADDHSLSAQLERKRSRRTQDESAKPLRYYRDEELAHCQECFFGPDRSYHEARRRFVYKQGPVGGRNDTAASMRARLREARRHYERHVLAWYALGRADLARAARATVRSHRRALDE